MADEKPAEAKKKKLVKGRHASAIKRHRQSVKRAEQNRSDISAVRSAIKKVIQAVRAKDASQAKDALKKAASLLHKSAKKKIIHDRNASRHIARLSALVTKLG